MFLALLQLHVAYPDDLAHKTNAGPDEVRAAEVLKWPEENMLERSGWVTLSSLLLLDLYHTHPVHSPGAIPPR